MNKKAILSPSAVKFFSILAVMVGLGMSACENSWEIRQENAIEHEIEDIKLDASKICLYRKCSNEEMATHVSQTAEKAKLKYSTLDNMGQLSVLKDRIYCSHHGEWSATNYRYEVYNWAMSEHNDLHRRW
jgi:hypothetical protein